MLAVDFSWETIRLASTVLVPAIAISAMGLWDDLRGLQPWPRLIAQTVTGIAVSFILIAGDTSGVAFSNTFLNYTITTLWIVGVCNFARGEENFCFRDAIHRWPLLFSLASSLSRSKGAMSELLRYVGKYRGERGELAIRLVRNIEVRALHRRFNCLNRTPASNETVISLAGDCTIL